MTSHSYSARMRASATVRVGLLLLAVGLVSGAGAWAGGTIRSSDIVDNTIRGRDIHSGAVAASDIKTRAVTAAKLNSSAVSAALPRTNLVKSSSSVALPAGSGATVVSVTVRAPAARRYVVDGLLVFSDSSEAYRANCGFLYDGSAHSGQYFQNVQTTASRPYDLGTLQDISDKLSAGLHTIALSCSGLLGANLFVVQGQLRVTEAGATRIASS